MAKTGPLTPFNLAAFFDSVNGSRTIAKYRKKEAIFSQGEAADAVFYLKAGKCKVTVVSDQGKEAIVALLSKGDFFGEGCLIGQTLRVSTVTAMADCTAMRIQKAAVVALLKSEPKFAEAFMAHLLTRNARVEEDLVDQLFNSSEKRLARVLLLMANFGKEGSPEPVLANLSQETLAEMIGTTRSRVSRFMNKFRRLGFIDYNGTLTVHNALLTVVLNDNPKLRNEGD